MLLKKSLFSVAFVASFSATAELSANIGATSNYIWRGVTQTMNGAAVSGGVDYSHESGIYAGTWISNVDFGLDEGSGTEVDFYAGYYGEVGDFSYDIGLSSYTYPSAGFEDSNFSEVYGNFFIGNFTLGLAHTFQSDLDDSSPFGQGDLYYSAGYSLDLSNGFSSSITYGLYNFDEDEVFYGDNDYSHILLDITKSDFTLSISKASKESGDDSTNIFVSYNQSF